MLCFDGAEVPLLEAVKAGATEQLVALFQGGDKEPTTAQEIRISASPCQRSRPPSQTSSCSTAGHLC